MDLIRREIENEDVAVQPKEDTLKEMQMIETQVMTPKEEPKSEPIKVEEPKIEEIKRMVQNNEQIKIEVPKEKDKIELLKAELKKIEESKAKIEQEIEEIKKPKPIIQPKPIYEPEPKKKKGFLKLLLWVLFIVLLIAIILAVVYYMGFQTGYIAGNQTIANSFVTQPQYNPAVNLTP